MEFIKKSKIFKSLNKRSLSSSCITSSTINLPTMTLSGGKIFRPWDEPKSSSCSNGYSDEECVKKDKDESSTKRITKVSVSSPPPQSSKSRPPPLTDLKVKKEEESVKFPVFSSHNHCRGSQLMSSDGGVSVLNSPDCFEPQSPSQSDVGSHIPSSPSQCCIDPMSPTEYADYHLNCSRNDESPSNLFLYPLAINELANLSRNELTAIGLLPPQPSTCHKSKRQRPKRFHCPHCQVAFSNNGQLRGHIRIHTGERPFVCEEDGCGKSFTRNEELTRHRRIHTGLRPFPCSYCGKKFGRKDHLKKHTRTHQRMYAPANMIGYGHPFQPFHPPILSSAVSSNDHHQHHHLNFSSLPMTPMLPSSMSFSHYPSSLSFE